MMSPLPPLTRNIGQTERTLQTLLAQQLAPSETTFQEWAALTLLYGGGRLGAAELRTALTSGNIAGPEAATALVASLIGKGTIAEDAGALGLTPAGKAFYEPLRAAVGRTTETLFRDIAPEDLDATRRTLDLVARRAAEMAAGT